MTDNRIEISPNPPSSGQASPGDGSSANAGARSGPWVPLHSPLFRMLWAATVISYVGTWINDTASAWTMTAMAPSPLLVALVQAATTLPLCALAIPAGVLADIVDRRRLLLAAQIWMAVSAAVLATLSATGLLTPWGLLAATFSLGIGAAITMPVWRATVPELVHRAELPAAVALGSLGINLSRAVGPALGGLIVASAGPAAAFALNAASFLAVIAALRRWQPRQRTDSLPPESFASALRAGLRYARQVAAVRAVLVRASAFFIFASAPWALMPLIVRQELGGDTTLYGILLAAVGGGAVAAALSMPRLLRRISRNRLATVASVLFAAATRSLALSRSLWLILPCMAIIGISWLCLMTSFQVAAQTAVPAWVRARILSLNIVVFAGSMAAGATLWGAVASTHSIAAALLLAALGTASGALLSWRFPLGEGDAAAHAASGHWPEPIVTAEVEPDRGPVLVTVEYQVALADRPAFLAAIASLGHARRRDGALRWGIFEDAAEPGLYMETFVVASWIEHLRQHHRVTVADRAIENAVHVFHRGPGRPRARHLLAGPPPARMPDDMLDDIRAHRSPDLGAGQ